MCVFKAWQNPRAGVRLPAFSRLAKRYCNSYNDRSRQVEYLSIIWDLDDDPRGNTRHIAEHGLTKDEIEEVLRHEEREGTSRSSRRPIAFGETSTGRFIAVVYERIDVDTLRPVTAYEIDL
jgi:uncharacterized DUF497 family protein